MLMLLIEKSVNRKFEPIYFVILFIIYHSIKVEIDFWATLMFC